MAESVDRAVADLRYGSIGVNVWHALSFAMGSTSWGAYPGHARTDIQSGTGVVGNTAMFDRPQKSIVRGPFRARPKPSVVRHGRRLLRRDAPVRRLRGRTVGGEDPGSAARRHAQLSGRPPGRPAPGRSYVVLARNCGMA